MPVLIAQYPELPERAGKLKAWDKFDAAYFGIRDKLAEIMDPLGRLVLEKAYEAIVDAGKYLIFSLPTLVRSSIDTAV